MNTKLLIPGVIAFSLCLASLTASAATERSDFLGDVVPPSAAMRTIVITPATKYVNVTQGETVKFETGGQEFAIGFDGTRSSFALNRLAPAGALDHDIEIYVAPHYLGS